MPWVQLALFVVSLIATILLRPKPPSANIKPADQIDFPRTEEGADLSILFGTKFIADPNVVWLGDISTKAIKSGGGKK